MDSALIQSHGKGEEERDEQRRRILAVLTSRGVETKKDIRTTEMAEANSAVTS